MPAYAREHWLSVVTEDADLVELGLVDASVLSPY